MKVIWVLGICTYRVGQIRCFLLGTIIAVNVYSKVSYTSSTYIFDNHPKFAAIFCFLSYNGTFEYFIF